MKIDARTQNPLSNQDESGTQMLSRY